MSKHTRGPIRIQKNTDTVDIDSKCLGLSCWIIGDSTSQLNTNRGLHIQIRHNRDKDTFEAANRVSHLIAAAPDLLEALEVTRDYLDSKKVDNLSAIESALVLKIRDAIAKARGSEGGES